MGITSAQLSDFKDVFLLFDKDQDGVLSFSELTYAVKVLGIIITGKSKILQILYKSYKSQRPDSLNTSVVSALTSNLKQWSSMNFCSS